VESVDQTETTNWRKGPRLG